MKCLLWALPVAAVLFGCATTSGTGDGESGGKKSKLQAVTDAASKAKAAMDDAVVTGDWELRMVTKGKDKQDMTNATMTVVEAGGDRYTFSGFAGVNNFNGSLTIGWNGAITVDPKIATTRMSGTAEAMAAEQTFLDALTAAASWKAVRVGVETLEMKGAGDDGVTLRFTRLSVMDRIWNLSAVLDDKGSAVVSVEAGARKATLMMDGKGKAHIFTGLNLTDAEYTADEGEHTLSFNLSNSAMTLASGSEEEMKTEQLYIKDLQLAASYSVNGKELSVMDSKDKVVMIFTAQDLL